MKKCTFKKGEYVVYGSNGICLVEDVCDFSFSADIPKKPYFILKPKNDPNSLIYIPCDNEDLVGRLRSIFSKAQIEALLHKHACEPADWQEDRKQRVLTFRSVLAKSDPLELLAEKGIRCGIALLEVLKPYDKTVALLARQIPEDCAVVTLEEEIRRGGMGMSLLDEWSRTASAPKRTAIMALDDNFAEQTRDEDIYKTVGLDAESIVRTVVGLIK